MMQTQPATDLSRTITSDSLVKYFQIPLKKPIHPQTIQIISADATEANVTTYEDLRKYIIAVVWGESEILSTTSQSLQATLNTIWPPEKEDPIRTLFINLLNTFASIGSTDKKVQDDKFDKGLLQNALFQIPTAIKTAPIPNNINSIRYFVALLLGLCGYLQTCSRSTKFLISLKIGLNVNQLTDPLIQAALTLDKRCFEQYGIRVIPEESPMITEKTATTAIAPGIAIPTTPPSTAAQSASASRDSGRKIEIKKRKNLSLEEHLKSLEAQLAGHRQSLQTAQQFGTSFSALSLKDTLGPDSSLAKQIHATRQLLTLAALKALGFDQFLKLSPEERKRYITDLGPSKQTEELEQLLNQMNAFKSRPTTRLQWLHKWFLKRKLNQSFQKWVQSVDQAAQSNFPTPVIMPSSISDEAMKHYQIRLQYIEDQRQSLFKQTQQTQNLSLEKQKVVMATWSTLLVAFSFRALWQLVIHSIFSFFSRLAFKSNTTTKENLQYSSGKIPYTPHRQTDAQERKSISAA